MKRDYYCRMSAKHATARDRLYEFLYHRDVAHLTPAQEKAFTAEVRAGYAALEQQVQALKAHDRRFELRQAPPHFQTLFGFSRFYGDTRPAGLGVKQGEYLSLSPQEAGSKTRLIATDFLMDCNAVALVARDARGQVLRTTLAHINISNEPKRALQQLLATMPAGAAIEATLISSGQNFNPYRQQELLTLLAATPQLSRIHFYRNQAATVLVDVHSGRFFFSGLPDYAVTAYNINELLVDIRFSSYNHNKMNVQTAPSWQPGQAIRVQVPLINAYDAAHHRFTNAGDLSPLIEQMQQHGATRERLGQLVSDISRWMERPMQVQFAPDSHARGQRQFKLQTAEGETLGSFVAPGSALPPKGRVQNR